MVYDVTLGQLMQAGLLGDGETVLALRKRVGEVEAIVHADGSVQVAAKVYTSLSAAASAVSGTGEAGWEYWGARRDGGLVSLFDLRAEFLRRRT
jgi:hypothetical protein